VGRDPHVHAELPAEVGDRHGAVLDVLGEEAVLERRGRADRAVDGRRRRTSSMARAGEGRCRCGSGPRAYWICTSDPIADVPEREAALRGADEDAWAALDTLADRK
jgi:hypothetical protein